MKTTIYLIGIALGLALGGAAHATGQTPSCQKTGNGHQCTVPGDTTIYNVNTESEATAIASVIAQLEQNQAQGQAQGQQQGQTSENTNTNQNVNGGNSVNISSPRLTGNVSIGATVVLFGGVQTNNDLGVAAALMNAGQTCDGLKVLYNTPSANRAGLGAPNCAGGATSITGQGFTECSFSKETGKLTVAPRTQYAAEACAITIGMDPSRVKL